MKLSRSIVWTCCALGAIVLGGLTAPRPGVAQERAGGPPPKPLVDKDHTRMMPEQADPNGNTPIFGAQNAEGFYAYRNHFGPHQTSKPHFHDKDRWVTVIKGTWFTGEGDVWDPNKMVAIPAGGFMFHPANMHHYDGSCDGEGTIVQIMGYGPVKTTQTEVDAAGKPAFANPANPSRGGAPDTRGCKGMLPARGRSGK
jgi:hypothetical protein